MDRPNCRRATVSRHNQIGPNDVHNATVTGGAVAGMTGVAAGSLPGFQCANGCSARTLKANHIRVSLALGSCQRTCTVAGRPPTPEKTSASPIVRPVTSPLNASTRIMLVSPVAHFVAGISDGPPLPHGSPVSMRAVNDWPGAIVVSAGTTNNAGVPAVHGSSLHAMQTAVTATNHQLLRSKTSGFVGK
jgi:hypothetical protein